MDTNLVRSLLDKRDALDVEIAAAVGGTVAERKRAPQKCGHCGQEGHNAKACPSKPVVE